MASGFTREDVVAIATLANLELQPEELDLFARQLAGVLEHVEEVQNVDTTGVPPTASVVTRHASDRSDVVQPSLDRDDALAGAPEAALDAGFFRVPRVIG